MKPTDEMHEMINSNVQYIMETFMEHNDHLEDGFVQDEWALETKDEWEGEPITIVCNIKWIGNGSSPEILVEVRNEMEQNLHDLTKQGNHRGLKN